jgi:predicted RNA-binding protein with PUA-like domain
MTSVGRRHTLKSWPESFQAVWDGIRPFEIRENDRDFRVGDSVVLHEWNEKTKAYTGRAMGARIMYVEQGTWGLPKNIAVLSLHIFSRYLDVNMRL